MARALGARVLERTAPAAAARGRALLGTRLTVPVPNADACGNNKQTAPCALPLAEVAGAPERFAEGMEKLVEFCILDRRRLQRVLLVGLQLRAPCGGT